MNSKEDAGRGVSCTVTGICRKRIRLELTLRVTKDGKPWEGEGADALQFYVVETKSRRCCGVFESVRTEGSKRVLTFLITNRGDNACLDPGTYIVAVCDGNGTCISDVVTAGDFCIASADETVLADGNAAKEPEDIRKTVKDAWQYTDNKADLIIKYPYRKGCHYTVRIKPGRVGQQPLILEVEDFDGKKNLRRFASDRKKDLVRCWYHLQKRSHAKSRKNSILFLRLHEGLVADNPEAVRERMMARGMDHKWHMQQAFINPSGRKRSFRDDIRLAGDLAKNSVVVIDEHVPMLDWLEIGKDLTLIQLWHAGVGFKATGYSRWGCKGAVSPMSSHRQITYATVSSVKVRDIFAELWGIAKEQIIPCGIPRMDRFLDREAAEETKRRLLAAYPDCTGRQVMLFAPTYRGRGYKDAHYPYERIDFHAMHRLAKEKGWIVLLKMHPWIRQKPPIPDDCKDLIMDAGKEQIEDLFQITDLLITDYSSALFEFSLLQKPMLFYAFDEEIYEKDRGFHRPYRENAPGKVVADFEALLGAIEAEDFESEKVTEYVRDHFDITDTNACDRVIDWLIEEHLPEEYKKALKAHEETVHGWKGKRLLTD